MPMTANQIYDTTMALKKVLIEHALGAELSPSGLSARQRPPRRGSQSAQRYVSKTVLTETCWGE